MAAPSAITRVMAPATKPVRTPASTPPVGPATDAWSPDNPVFWRAQGQHIAARNLRCSVPALVLAFAVWMVWSAVVVQLPAVGFRYTLNQLFWLTALPALSGATLRIFYAFAVPVVGGRRWTVLTTVSLLAPAIGIGLAVQRPGTPYELMLGLALLCGLGGGNFASSMAHIRFLYPKAQKGRALGLNAGLGSLGVSLAQLLVPLVISVGLLGALGGAPQIADDGRTLWLQNAGFVWVPLIALSALAAWRGMNDLPNVRADFTEQAVIFKRKHNWLMCWLSIGSLGSFIGYSAGLPLLTHSLFPAADPLAWAWSGPLLGALAQPLGAWLADKQGGARVALWSFVLMLAGVLALLQCLPGGTPGAAGASQGHFQGFLAAFALLFVSAGAANGATFRMIPNIFLTERLRAAAGQGPKAQDQAVKDAGIEAAAVLGFASAVGAYGGFFIPKSYGTSLSLTGGPEAALYVFAAFYASCIAVTWWYCVRKSAHHNAHIPC